MTKRQHYVQQAYLERWCAGGRFVVRIGGRILENQSPLNYANEKWFYSFVDLSASELDYLLRALTQAFDLRKQDMVRNMFGTICLNVLRFRCEKSDYSTEYDKVFCRIADGVEFGTEWRKMFAVLVDGACGKHPISKEDLERFSKSAAEGFESFQCCIENVAAPFLAKET